MSAEEQNNETEEPTDEEKEEGTRKYNHIVGMGACWVLSLFLLALGFYNLDVNPVFEPTVVVVVSLVLGVVIMYKFGVFVENKFMDHILWYSWTSTLIFTALVFVLFSFWFCPGNGYVVVHDIQRGQKITNLHKGSFYAFGAPLWGREYDRVEASFSADRYLKFSIGDEQTVRWRLKATFDLNSEPEKALELMEEYGTYNSLRSSIIKKIVEVSRKKIRFLIDADFEKEPGVTLKKVGFTVNKVRQKLEGMGYKLRSMEAEIRT